MPLPPALYWAFVLGPIGEPVYAWLQGSRAGVSGEQLRMHALLTLFSVKLSPRYVPDRDFDGS